MKNRISSLFLTLIFVFTLQQVAFANGEVRDLKPFNTIDVSGSVKVILKKGTDHNADIVVKDAELSDLITEVDNGQLKIYFKRNLFKFKNKHATVTVTYVELKAIDADSGCYVGAHSIIECEEFELDCSSGSSVVIELDATTVDINVSSGSSLTLLGRAYGMEVKASSGSSIGAGDMECSYIDVDASSGSNVKVWALDDITAKASSGSTISYKGKPAKTDIEKDVSASVRSLK